MKKFIDQLLSMYRRMIASIAVFSGLTPYQKRIVCVTYIKEHVVATVIVAGILIVIGGCMMMPPQGRIITMGPEMRKAFDLLNTTHTGKELISKARRSTRGSPIFLSLGSTAKDDLVDANGETVVGVTRAYFERIANVYLPNGMFIYSNKDVLDTRPDLIALNIAFELENVIFAMKYPGIESGDDSPEAWETLKKVAQELGLTDRS